MARSLNSYWSSAEVTSPDTEASKLHEVKPEIADTGCSFKPSDQPDRCDATGDWAHPSDIEILCKKAA
jgi:hypothetical protein